MTKKPKTTRKARFTGALARPIVRTPMELAVAAALLRGEDPAPLYRAEQARIDDEIARKIALLVEHYGIDATSEGGDILPRLALALCFDLVDGFKFVGHAPKRGRPSEDWGPFYRFVKEHQREGQTIAEACKLYQVTLTGRRKPAVSTLENRFHKCEAEEREKSVKATDRLIQALMQAQKREPEWMTRLRGLNGGEA